MQKKKKKKKRITLGKWSYFFEIKKKLHVCELL
jgi:hypothetical protein